jgi:hypothetical protein
VGNILNREGNAQQKRYFDQLSHFFNELRNTAYLLRKRQHLLLLQSKGEKFSFSKFRQIENRYQQQAEACRQEGEKLNKLIL